MTTLYSLIMQINHDFKHTDTPELSSSSSSSVSIPFYNPKNQTFKLFPAQRSFEKDVFNAIEKDCRQAQAAVDPPIDIAKDCKGDSVVSRQRRLTAVTRCPGNSSNSAQIVVKQLHQFRNRESQSVTEASRKLLTEILSEWFSKRSTEEAPLPEHILAAQLHR